MLDSPDTGDSELYASKNLDGKTVPQFGLRNLKLPYAAIRHLLAFFDAVLIVLSSVIGGEAYQIYATGDYASAEPLLGAGLIAGLLYVLIGQSTGFYDIGAALSKRRDFRQIFAQWSLVSLLLTLLAFLMKVGPAFSRGSIICFAIIALVALLACRRLSKRLVVSVVADGRVQGRRAILLGTRDELAALSLDEMLRTFWTNRSRQNCFLLASKQPFFNDGF